MEPNSSPFTSPPYDIFRKIIFDAYAYTPEPEEYDESLLLLDVVSPPILASHVCRSWRYALLSDPIMWTCLLIPKIKPSGITELLRRSGSALLDVFLKLKANPSHEVDYDEMSTMLSSVFQKIHRFRIFHVQVDPKLRETQFQPDFLRTLRQTLSYLTQPAPNLQMFFFWSRDLHDNLLDTLFSGNAPNLKHIHHRFFPSLKEISCPLFHDLFELHFSFPDESTMDFGLFLDFLKLSPRLQFLRVYVDRYDVSAFSEFSPERRVNLPNLQMLVLEVNRTVELLDLILENVSFPSSVKWQIIFQYLPESADPLPQALESWMSRIHFTSLRISIARGEAVRLSFGENTSSKYINRFNDNKIVYLSEDMSDLMDLWYPVLESLESLESSLESSFESSDITSLDIFVEFGNLTEMETFRCQVFPEIIDSASSMVSLTIRNKHTHFFRNDEPSLPFLSELIPDNLPALERALEYNRNTVIIDDRNLVQNLESLVLSGPSTTARSACPCPNLRELHVELEGPLMETDVAMLRTCARRRREEGHPLRIFVRCVEMRGVESMRRLQEDGDISFSVVPFAIEWD